MAKIGGRNIAMAWLAGLGCLAVVAILVGLALPAVTPGLNLAGSMLRGNDTAAFLTSTPREPGATTTPECQAIYTEALWMELTQRVGGDPVQDAAPPATSVPSLTAALAPTVRVTCAFTAVNAGSVVTTVSDLGSSDAVNLAEATLEASGFGCEQFGEGLRCRKATDDGATEENIVRDAVWVSSTFRGWEPARYDERIAQQLWP